MQTLCRTHNIHELTESKIKKKIEPKTLALLSLTHTQHTHTHDDMANFGLLLLERRADTASIDPTRRWTAKSQPSHWPCPPPLSTLSTLATGPFPSWRSPVGDDPAPPVAVRRAAEYHRSHSGLQSPLHLHVNMDAPRPCTMPLGTLSSLPLAHGGVTFRRAPRGRRRWRASEARRGPSLHHFFPRFP